MTNAARQHTRVLLLEIIGFCRCQREVRKNAAEWRAHWLKT
jgi:hypothetical protein